MFFGRFLGWILLLAAFFTASAEAVAALSAREYNRIVTSDVVVIVTGLSPHPSDALARQILSWPAWLSVGLVGLLLVFFCRSKKYKSSFPARN